MKKELFVNNTDLVDFQVSNMGKTIRMTFSFDGYAGGEGQDVVITLKGASEMRISIVADQDEIFFIGKAWAEINEDFCEIYTDGEFCLYCKCDDYSISRSVPIVTAAKKNNFAVVSGVILEEREKVAA